MKIILASASPRRCELMKKAGIEFTVMPSQGEEKTTASEPSAVVEELSLHKAQEIFAKYPEGPVCVIGSDTVVSCGGEILEKPADKAGARRMIGMLQGRTHEVYTGVSILWRPESGEEKNCVFHECTKVHVYPMTQEEIEEYINTPEPYDKAGAYGIQGSFMVYVKGIEGDYNNVVGLPVSRLVHELKDNGII